MLKIVKYLSFTSQNLVHLNSISLVKISSDYISLIPFIANNKTFCNNTLCVFLSSDSLKTQTEHNALWTYGSPEAESKDTALGHDSITLINQMPGSVRANVI